MALNKQVSCISIIVKGKPKMSPIAQLDIFRLSVQKKRQTLQTISF